MNEEKELKIMTKKILTILLAFAMLAATACSQDSTSEPTKNSSSVSDSSQVNTESENSSESDADSSSASGSDSSSENSTDDSSTVNSETTSATTTTTKNSTTTTTTKAQATTTTKQAVATTRATQKPVQTTKATVRATAKATTKATVKTTPKPTQPAANKSALDLAYEAVILGTSTKAQRDLICNDLNNYVIAKGYSKKLDKSLYALSDANGKPVEDVTKAVGWGNSGFEGGSDNSTYTTAYLLGKSTLEKAREDYKVGLRSNIDYCAKTTIEYAKKAFVSKTFRFNIITYKDTGNAVQRLDLKYKYNIPRYTTVLCYDG